MFPKTGLQVWRFIAKTANRPGECLEVISKKLLVRLRRFLAALVLLGGFACASTGCGPIYDYPGYPAYGYAPYSTWGWGGWGYDPDFDVDHPWEEHHRFGHHMEFYHGGFGDGFRGGFHGGGFHGGGWGHGGGHH